MDLGTISPLFSKEGLGEILQSVIKIPLCPPLRKGDWEGNFLKSTTLVIKYYRKTNYLLGDASIWKSLQVF